ncbi:hypothetical protein EYF80_047528 [Liparis tanakae]|uniref:Uncharacterized protein n=1 Tax=Liparis tanakae TaxID=230148 RepID=A0A4Z2FN49_9TELE|nr:hypothetical protein EYF80_047528 [Liparis tanakae]
MGKELNLCSSIPKQNKFTMLCAKITLIKPQPAENPLTSHQAADDHMSERWAAEQREEPRAELQGHKENHQGHSSSLVVIVLVMSAAGVWTGFDASSCNR